MENHEQRSNRQEAKQAHHYALNGKLLHAVHGAETEGSEFDHLHEDKIREAYDDNNRPARLQMKHEVQKKHNKRQRQS